MSNYNDFMKEAMEFVEEANNRYPKVRIENFEETVEEIEISKLKKEKARLQRIENIREIKLEGIEMTKNRIKILKIKITKERKDFKNKAENVAYNCQKIILGLEEEMKNDTSKWIYTGNLKSLEKYKQGYYGSELEQELKWLKHLYIEFNEWEDDNNEN